MKDVFKKEELKLSQTKTYCGLYCLKAICSLFVVIYHVPVLFGNYTVPITGTAVPCFFMISGFFLYSNSREREIQTAWKWIKKIIVISFLLNVFYFFVYQEKIIENFENDINWYLPVLLQGGVFCGVLWYLTAFWEALLVFIVVRYYFSNKLFYVAPLFVLLGLYAGKYGFLFGRAGGEIRPWLFQSFLAAAIPYMSLGYIIHKHKENFIGRYKWVICSIVFMFFIYFERYLLSSIFFIVDNGTFYIFTTPLSFSFFIMALNYNKNIRYVVIIGKKHASNIYYFHMFFATVFYFLFVPKMSWFYQYFAAIFIYLFCILISILFLHVKNEVSLKMRHCVKT